MNYTAVNADCVCEKPMASVPVNRGNPPPLPQQLAALTERIGMVADRLNKLSLFLADTGIDPDRVDDKSVSASIAFAVRMCDTFCGKLDYLNEICR